jgi:hypothetical protein
VYSEGLCFDFDLLDQSYRLSSFYHELYSSYYHIHCCRLRLKDAIARVKLTYVGIPVSRCVLYGYLFTFIFTHLNKFNVPCIQP